MAAAVVVTGASVAESDIVVHMSPVWRNNANFIIQADIREPATSRSWEQLWARQVGESRFIICCIPFFVYDLALDDEVRTATRDGRQFVVDEVVKPSGHYTFRAWFGSAERITSRDELPDLLKQLGAEFEWYSQNLVAIDASDDSHAQAIANLLADREHHGELVYETGRKAMSPGQSPE